MINRVDKFDTNILFAILQYLPVNVIVRVALTQRKWYYTVFYFHVFSGNNKHFTNSATFSIWEKLFKRDFTLQYTLIKTVQTRKQLFHPIYKWLDWESIEPQTRFLCVLNPFECSTQHNLITKSNIIFHGVYQKLFVKKFEREDVVKDGAENRLDSFKENPTKKTSSKNLKQKVSKLQLTVDSVNSSLAYLFFLLLKYPQQFAMSHYRKNPPQTQKFSILLKSFDTKLVEDQLVEVKLAKKDYLNVRDKVKERNRSASFAKQTSIEKVGLLIYDLDGEEEEEEQGNSKRLCKYVTKCRDYMEYLKSEYHYIIVVGFPFVQTLRLYDNYRIDIIKEINDYFDTNASESSSPLNQAIPIPLNYNYASRFDMRGGRRTILMKLENEDPTVKNRLTLLDNILIENKMGEELEINRSSSTLMANDEHSPDSNKLNDLVFVKKKYVSNRKIVRDMTVVCNELYILDHLWFDFRLKEYCFQVLYEKIAQLQLQNEHSSNCLIN